MNQDVGVALFQCNAGITMGIILTERFTNALGKLVSEIGMDKYVGKLIKVYGQVLRISCDGKTLQCNVTTQAGGELINMLAVHTQVVFPNADYKDAETSDREAMFQLCHIYDVETMQIILDTLWSVAKDQKNTGKITTTSDTVLPYHLSEGKIVSVAQGSGENGPAGTGAQNNPVARQVAEGAKRNSMNKLIKRGVAGCSKKFPWKLCRQHTGWHIRIKGVPLCFPCNLYACNPALQYHALTYIGCCA